MPPARPRRRKPMGPKKASARVIGYIVLIGLSIISIVPLVWMLTTAVRPRDTVFGGSLVPTQLTGSAFANAVTQVDIFRNFFNSVEVVAATVLITLFTATLGGYAFAKLAFRAKTTIYLLLLSTLMLPGATILIPLFLELKQFHLVNSKPGLVLVYVATSTPLAIMLMRSFFTRIPGEMRDSARVDGAGEFLIFRRIMVPLARPGIASVSILLFLFTWNEFLFAVTFIQNPSTLTLQPAIFALVGQYSTNWPVLCASLTISVVPIVVAYVLLQRHFVAGLTMGAVKG
jgi:ABC-type glycerol-3-phosphate transport system permease component